MKTSLQYVTNSKGKTTSVQVPLSEWEKLLGKLKKYEQSLKMKSGLQEAFAEVEVIKKQKQKSKHSKNFPMSYNIIAIEKFKREAKRLAPNHAEHKNSS